MADLHPEADGLLSMDLHMHGSLEQLAAIQSQIEHAAYDDVIHLVWQNAEIIARAGVVRCWLELDQRQGQDPL